MKDNRPSRKESKAQDNIREYLQDIAMGYTTHVKTSTVGMWRNRYNKQRDVELIYKGYKTIPQKIEWLKAIMRANGGIDLHWKIAELEQYI